MSVNYHTFTVSIEQLTPDRELAGEYLGKVCSFMNSNYPDFTCEVRNLGNFTHVYWSTDKFVSNKYGKEVLERLIAEKIPYDNISRKDF